MGNTDERGGLPHRRPAAGKSSVGRRLRELDPALSVWEYGERLTAHLRARGRGALTQAGLRDGSAQIAAPADIEAVDGQRLEFVAGGRLRGNVLIDSHPVTKERYGFRVTPYSIERFQVLAPTQIWMLYTDPEVAVSRIYADPQGRPGIKVEEARSHAHMQASVAITYGMALGVPIRFFDSNRPLDDLCMELGDRLSPSAP